VIADPVTEGTDMQSSACLERMRLWHKRAWLVAFLAGSGIGPIAASTTCFAQGAIESADQVSGPSKDTAATAVFIVEAKKCEEKAPPGAWSESERWAWQQICRHLNVDFDEKEANAVVEEQMARHSCKPDEDSPTTLFRNTLEKLRAQNNKDPEKLAADPSRRLSSKFLAMIFGDAELRSHTWTVPLKLFGFHTDRFVIDTATLKSLDIRYAYVGTFLIQNTTIDGDLRFDKVHLAGLKARFVTATHFLLDHVSVTTKTFGLGLPSTDQPPLAPDERDGALAIDTARIGDRLSVLEGNYGAIDLKHVKVDDLFIYHPAWNATRESGPPELSITESVDNGVFTFQANPGSVLPQRIKLSQFIFANAYLGPDPMPVIHAMDADAGIRPEAAQISDRPDLEPYTLIAQSYAKRGETGISDQVLIAKNNQDWHWANLSSLDFLALTFTWLVADYGFHPEVGFAWIGGFVLLGWGVFWYASGRLAAGSYQPKSPFLLALDSVIPGIRLDKNHEDVRYDGWPQIMLYLLRVLGAVLVFVALSYLQKKLLG
jgi:hypothetical protein